MYKILKNTIEMDDYSVQKLSNLQPPEPFEWNTVEGTELNVSDCIGGKGKIEVKGNTYQKQLSGKNLWGGFSYSRTASGVTHIYNKDGTFTINGTATANSDSLISSAAISEGIYKTFPAGTYTISGGTSEVLLYVVRTNGNTIANTSSTTFTKSFTLTEETDLFIRSRVNEGVTVNNETVYCMVESGSTATDYEPYCGGQASPNPDYPQPIKVVTGNNVIKNVGKNYNLNLGTIELCKIDDYQDILFKNVVGDENYNAELEEGAWYKKSAIAEVVLDGRETWNYNSGNRYFFTNKFLDNYVTQYTKLVSNNYIGGMASNGGLYNNHIQTGTAYSFMLCDNRFTDKNDLKTWLSTHNTIVKYPLATPTYEKITDPTLISQLEALKKAKWFKGTNHWWTETNNLEAVLKGTYRQAINE